MSQSINPKHIVVVCEDKTSDVFLALPVFQTLRSSFPQARITAMVSPQGQAVVQNHPSIDNVVVIPMGEGFFKLAGRLRKLKADTFINLDPISRWILAAWLAKIPLRIGMDYKWHNFLLTRTAKINRAVSDRNEVEYNFELLKLLGVSQFVSKIDFPINESEKTKMIDLLVKKGISAEMPYVVVHPGARGKALYWKAEKFGQLLSYLCQVKGLRVVVTYSADEGALVSEVTAVLFSLPLDQKPVLVNTSELVLKELATLCSGAICLLSGPLGPMHLAAAVGTPTVTIFSPTPEATPTRWGAWGNENIALTPYNPQCNACQVGYCKKHDPMEALTVPEVFEAMKKFISRKIVIQ